MTTRRMLVSLVLLTCVSLTACATGSSDVPVSERSHPAWLTGTWKGEAWQTAAKRRQKGGEDELWGMVEARYGSAAVSVTRMP